MKLKLLSLLLLIVVITACSIDGNENKYCTFQGQMATTAVTGADSTKVNVPVNLNVTFVIGNNCGQFNQFLSTAAYPKSIVALVDYTGCECDDKSYTQTKPYTFAATAAGTYVLKFLTENELSPITKTIVVTAE
ncbi:hypothetical protein [Flavobacterium psychrotrophum]|uniref:hypothetical protein n=1 Tax=Flavobacterium psychrotrophum TaxID=2294119 RepID=UPI000E30DCCA|nr:hypothetical protein [Flavobacterium psychrotrophum]